MENSADFQEPTQAVDDIALDNLIEQYGDETRAMVKIYRVEKGEPDALVDQMEPSGFEFLHFAKKHGRGTYRIKVYAPNEFGKVVMKVNKLERYEGAVEAAIVPPQPGNSDAVMALADAMLKGFEKLGALIVQTQTPTVDPAAQRRVMLEEMALMRDMFAPNPATAQPVQSLDSMLSLFQKGLELGQGMNPAEPAEGMAGFLQAIKPFAEPLGKIVENIASKQTAAPAPQPARVALQPPVARPDAVETRSPESQPPEDPEMFASLKYRPFKNYIDQLVAVVQNNPETDPYAYACMILDNVPNEALEILLADGQMVDNFIKVSPAVADHRVWFDELAKELHELTKPEEPGSVDPHVSGQRPLTPPDA